MAYAQPHVIADEDEALEASSRDLAPLRDATSRSSELTKGNRGRIFMVYFLYLVLLYIVILLWEIPIFAMLGIFTHAGQQHPIKVLPIWTQIAFPVCTFLSQCLVGPLLTNNVSISTRNEWHGRSICSCNACSCSSSRQQRCCNWQHVICSR